MLDMMTPERIRNEVYLLHPTFRQFWNKLELEVCRILFFGECARATGLNDFSVPGLTLTVDVPIPKLPACSTSAWTIYKGIEFFQDVDRVILIEALLSGAEHEIADCKARHEERVRRYNHETK